MASFMVVKDYATEVMSSLGVKLSKTSKITCYTEVGLKNNAESKIRPDGLIVITTGNKEWRALIEAKVGNTELDKEQIERYLDLAKELNIDAVITISNQFTSDPKNHPVTISGHKVRSVSLYHWSWAYLMSEAVMWVKYHGVSDPEQAFILEELVRYLEHDSSGVTSIDRVNAEWKEVCSAIQNRLPLNKNAEMVRQSAGTWHQLARSISLKLSLKIGRSVSIHIPKNLRDDNEARIRESSEQLVNDKTLDCHFDVPNAASRIKLTADFGSRTICCSMRIKAPEDKATAKGRINWVVNQLKKSENQQILIKAIWPSRTVDTYANLKQLREDDFKAILGDVRKDLLPTAFEITLSKDLAGKFSGAKAFVDELEPLILSFYKDVGQNLREWVASAPKIRPVEELAEIPNELSIESNVITANVTQLEVAAQVESLPDEEIIQQAKEV